MELEQLQEYYGTVRSYGIEIYAVSIAPPEINRSLREHIGADYIFLSDNGGLVLDQLNIDHQTPNPSGRDIPIPTQILVDREGIIRWIYQPSNYRIRAKPETVLEVLKELNVE